MNNVNDPIHLGHTLNKVKAYKKVTKNYYDAVSVLNSKKLAFGEPAVVPFYYPDESDLDRVVKLAVGYGSINGGVEIFSNINNGGDSSTRIDNAECAVMVDGQEQVMKISDAFNYIIEKLEGYDYGSLSEEEINKIIHS